MSIYLFVLLLGLEYQEFASVTVEFPISPLLYVNACFMHLFWSSVFRCIYVYDCYIFWLYSCFYYYEMFLFNFCRQDIVASLFNLVYLSLLIDCLKYSHLMSLMIQMDLCLLFYLLFSMCPFFLCFSFIALFALILSSLIFTISVMTVSLYFSMNFLVVYLVLIVYILT